MSTERQCKVTIEPQRPQILLDLPFLKPFFMTIKLRFNLLSMSSPEVSANLSLSSQVNLKANQRMKVVENYI